VKVGFGPLTNWKSEPSRHNRRNGRDDGVGAGALRRTTARTSPPLHPDSPAASYCDDGLIESCGAGLAAVQQLTVRLLRARQELRASESSHFRWTRFIERLWHSLKREETSTSRHRCVPFCFTIPRRLTSALGQHADGDVVLRRHRWARKHGCGHDAGA
jgi:hypothetical protein